MVVRDQVGEAGRQLPHRRLDGRNLPAVAGDRDRDGADAAGGHGRQRTVVGRLLDQDAVTGLGVGGQDQADRVQRAGGHHDLVGLGREPSGGVPLRQRHAQGRHPGQFDADVVQVRRHLFGRLCKRTGRHRGGCGEGGRREVDRRRGGRDGGDRGHRQRGGAARTPPPEQVAVLPHLGIGRRHRGAGHPERVGQRALAGELSTDRNPAVDDQHAQAVGETLIRRTARVGRAPVAQFPHQEVHLEASAYQIVDHSSQFASTGY